jgi:hypothetical protein
MRNRAAVRCDVTDRLLQLAEGCPLLGARALLAGVPVGVAAAEGTPTGTGRRAGAGVGAGRAEGDMRHLLQRRGQGAGIRDTGSADNDRRGRGGEPETGPFAQRGQRPRLCGSWPA